MSPSLTPTRGMNQHRRISGNFTCKTIPRILQCFLKETVHLIGASGSVRCISAERQQSGGHTIAIIGNTRFHGNLRGRNFRRRQQLLHVLLQVHHLPRLRGAALLLWHPLLHILQIRHHFWRAQTHTQEPDNLSSLPMYTNYFTSKYIIPRPSSTQSSRGIIQHRAPSHSHATHTTKPFPVHSPHTYLCPPLQTLTSQTLIAKTQHQNACQKQELAYNPILANSVHGRRRPIETAILPGKVAATHASNSHSGLLYPPPPSSREPQRSLSTPDPAPELGCPGSLLLHPSSGAALPPTSTRHPGQPNAHLLGHQMAAVAGPLPAFPEFAEFYGGVRFPGGNECVSCGNVTMFTMQAEGVAFKCRFGISHPIRSPTRVFLCMILDNNYSRLQRDTICRRRYRL